MYSLQFAVAHTEPGTVVALGGSRDGAGGAVVLWVRDEGEGMTEDVRRRVFERFHRGEDDAAEEAADRAADAADR
jgi:two-component system OmpR family sensor kinase